MERFRDVVIGFIWALYLSTVCVGIWFHFSDSEWVALVPALFLVCSFTAVLGGFL